MAKKSKKKHQVKSVHVRKGDSGYAITHDMPPDAEGMPQPSQEHFVPGMPELQQHLQDHMGEDGEAQAASQ